MKKILYSVMCSTVFFAAGAQVKVGNNPTTINASSVLEVESTNQGLLLPRVALSATTTPALVGGAHVAGMTVYNTATAGDVTPGYYYNDGTKWVRLASASSDWHIVGNAATTPPTVVGTAIGANNYWGTSDAKNLAVGTNGTTRAIFDQNGSLYGGTATYDPTVTTTANSLVWGNTNIDSSKNSFVFGQSNILSTGTFGGSTQTNRGVILGGGSNQVLGVSYNSMVNGSQNLLTGASFENIVDGYLNTLNGSQKMIVSGQGNTATGAVFGFLNGLNNTLNGGYGIVQGNVNSVSADYGFAMGSNNTIGAGSNYSFSLGLGNTVAASNSSSMAVGTNSTTTVASQYVSNFSGGYQYYIAAAGNTTAATPAMVIASTTGNVGIGTVSPANLLDVDGNVNGNVVARIYNTNAGASATALLSFGVDNSGSGAYIFETSSGYMGGAGPRSLNIANGSSNPIVFSQGGSEKMRISGGNLCINTTSSTAPLQVVGLVTYASDAAAATGGLTAGAFYKDASGLVHVKL